MVKDLFQINVMRPPVPEITTDKMVEDQSYKGHGSPEGVIPARIGQPYVDLDSGAIWVKLRDDLQKSGWAQASGGEVFADWFEEGDGDDALLARAVAAMGTLGSGNIGTLRLNARTYTLTAPWVVGPNEHQYAQIATLRIIGQGSGGVDGGTQILQTSSNSDALQVNDAQVVIEHILFRNSNTSNSGNGINITDSAHGVIQHCAFMKFGSAAIRFSGSANHTWQIKNNFGQNCGWGVIASTNTQLIASTIGPRNEFTSTEAVGTRTGVGIEVTHAINVAIIENTLEVLRDGIVINGADGGDCSSVSIVRNYFEAIDQYGVHLCANSQLIGSVTIDSNFWNLTDADWGIYSGASSLFGLIITNNNLVPNDPNFINLSNVTGFRRTCEIRLSGGDYLHDVVLPTSDIALPKVVCGSTQESTKDETLSGNITINGTDNATHLYLTPSGAHRNVSPYNSTFRKRNLVKITNSAAATYNVVFDPSGLNVSILPQETATFEFLGGVSGWAIHKDTAIMAANSLAFRGVSFSFAGNGTVAGTFGVTGTVTLLDALLLPTGRITFGTINSVVSYVLRVESTYNMVFQFAGSVGATMDAAGAWAIGDGVPTAPTTRIFEIQGINRFSRPWPSGTKAQRDAIVAGNGDSWYQTDNTPGLRVYENGAWVRYTATADP